MSKKYKELKTKDLLLQPYGEMLTVICCSDLSKVLKKIKKVMADDINNDWEKIVEHTYQDKYNVSACFVSIPEDNQHFICFQKPIKTLYDISILAHEALHVTHKILSRRGLYLTSDTEEAYTYFQQYIIRKAGHFLMNI